MEIGLKKVVVKLFGVDHDRSTADYCCGVISIQGIQLVIIDELISCLVPDLDPEQVGTITLDRPINCC